MRLDRYISAGRIIDLESTTFPEALSELMHRCRMPQGESKQKKELISLILNQEQTVSSYLGNGIALPHLRLSMKKKYWFAIGRCKTPIQSQEFDKGLKIIVLLLASKKEKGYLNMLATLARVLQSIELIQDAEKLSLPEFSNNVISLFRGTKAPRQYKKDRFNRLMLKEATKISRYGNCSALFLFADTFTEQLWETPIKDMKTVIVTSNATEVSQKDGLFVLPTQLFTMNRLSQLRSSILVGLTHKIIFPGDKICCIGGTPKSNQLDTVLIVEVDREVQSIFSNQKEILPENVQPEVFERLLTIATELAVEGREGKSVGCLFILGNIEELRPYVKPLILNPFHGYEEEDRNLLNPFIDETVKEFSLLDGAFVIGGNGVLDSAGSLIHVPEGKIDKLPGGFGTRHAAALSISLAANCIALTVSASTGQVTIFRKGKMLPLIEKGIANQNLALGTQ